MSYDYSITQQQHFEEAETQIKVNQPLLLVFPVTCAHLPFPFLSSSVLRAGELSLMETPDPRQHRAGACPEEGSIRAEDRPAVLRGFPDASYKYPWSRSHWIKRWLLSGRTRDSWGKNRRNSSVSIFIRQDNKNQGKSDGKMIRPHYWFNLRRLPSRFMFFKKFIFT